MDLTDICFETRFLIDLCAGQRGLVPANPIEPKIPIDWNRFLKNAARHKVVGLVYRAFCSGSAPLPPPDIFKRLKQEAAAKAAAKAMQFAEWELVRRNLEAAHIRVLMVKGPALSLQLYGDAGARESRDIDLLVDSAKLGKTIELFRSIGYSTIDESFNFNDSVTKYQKKYSRHIGLKKNNSPTYFEVHGIHGTDIVLAPIPVEAVFARSEILRLDNLTFPTLARDDHALVVLLHGAHHSWYTLQWVLDAMAVIRNRSIDFDRLIALKWHGEDTQFTLDSFSLFASMLFSDSALDRFLPPQGKRMERAIGLLGYVIDQFATGGMGHSKYRLKYKTTSYLWKLSRGPSAKLKSLSWIATPNINDFKFLKNARLPFFIYYLARPFLGAHRIARWYLDNKKPSRT